MFSHQIFNDHDENSTAVQNIKSNETGNVKSFGLKHATNTTARKKLKAVPGFEVNPPNTLMKKTLEKTTHYSKELPTKSMDTEEWPEVENMFIYNEPMDDYEDIIPMSERITSADMDCLFDFHCIGYSRIPEYKVPVPELEELEEFEESICLQFFEEDMKIEFPVIDVPLPENPFDAL